MQRFSCVTLDQFLNLSVPLFPLQKMGYGDNNGTWPGRAEVRINELRPGECTEVGLAHSGAYHMIPTIAH